MTPFIRPYLTLFYAVMLLLVYSVAQAQKPTDQLFKKDGTSIAAKVLEVTTTEIKYKKASNPDGPTYTVLKSDVTKIIYANGEEESYSANTPAPKASAPNDETPFGMDNFLTFSLDGREVITDLTLPDQKTYLCYWSYDSKLKRKILFDNRREFQGLYNWQVVAADGSYVKGAELYDRSGAPLTTFLNPQTRQPFGKDANGTIISPDGKRILIKTGAGKGSIFLFDNGGNLLKTIKQDGWTGIGAWKFSNDSEHFLFSVGKGLSKKGLILVFDASGNSVSEITIGSTYEDIKYYSYNRYGYAANKAYMAFSYDDKMIIAADNDETVGVWDLSGKLIKSLPHFHAKVVAFSRDGKQVVTAGGLPYGKEETVNGKTYSGGQIKVWSIDGSLIKEISFPTNPGSVEFTPDNSGLVVTVEGSAIWLWVKDDYKLPGGYDQALAEVAKLQEDARVAQKASEKRARQSNMWGGFAKGFIVGMAQAGKELEGMSQKTAASKKFINEQVNKAIADCHYVAFIKIIDDDIAISDIFKINRACELNTSGCQVKFGDSHEEVEKWIKATIATEDKKANGRAVVSFDEWNKHFKTEAYAGQGGCLCK